MCFDESDFAVKNWNRGCGTSWLAREISSRDSFRGVSDLSTLECASSDISFPVPLARASSFVESPDSVVVTVCSGTGGATKSERLEIWYPPHKTSNRLLTVPNYGGPNVRSKRHELV